MKCLKHVPWIIAVFLLLGTSAGWSDEPAAAAEKLKGEVLEVQDVPNYTYLRLKTASGETWVAVSSAKLAIGAAVTIENAELIDNFESKALGKTFEQIYFGSLPQVPLSATEAAALVASAHAQAAKAKAAANSPIIKASGADGHTVAEIITHSAELKGHTVSVRAQVVKYSAGVMGKNWLHLRDGSGSKADASDDLVVTTQETAVLGAVLLVTGLVHKDKDFGAGYAYKVLLEEATLQE